jgi:type IX secretion system PorP/SprF family membrane protein
MRQMRKTILIVFIHTSILISVKSQDPVFSQFFLNSINLNPAAAGSANAQRVFLQYRNDWPEFSNAFVTYQGSYDQYIKAIHSGFGFNILRDNQAGGILTSTNVDLIYSYRIKINNDVHVQAGLQSTFQFIGSNFADFKTNPDNLNSRQSTQPDFSIGFLYMTRNAQIGLSVHHLNSGYLSFDYSNFVKSPLKISLFYTRNIKIHDASTAKENGFIISPSILVQKQDQALFVNYGAGVSYNMMFWGLWARNNYPFQFTSIIFSAGITFNNIRLGYSYDYSVLSLDNLTPMTGAHEFSVIYIIPHDSKAERYGPIKCPKIAQ